VIGFDWKSWRWGGKRKKKTDDFQKAVQETNQTPTCLMHVMALKIQLSDLIIIFNIVVFNLIS